jgi:hypothetical protein
MVGGRTPAKGDDRKTEPVAKSTPAKVDDRKSKAVAKMKLKIPPVATSPSFDSGWDYSKPNEATSASLESGNPSGTEEDGKPEAVETAPKKMVKSASSRSGKTSATPDSHRKRAPMEATPRASKEEEKRKKEDPPEPKPAKVVRRYRKTKGLPEWMFYATLEIFPRYWILGVESQIRSALYLTIKVAFPFVFSYQKREWAKLTLSGLNKVMNFFEIMSVPVGKSIKISNISNKWPLKMQDLEIPKWEKMREFLGDVNFKDDDASAVNIRQYEDSFTHVINGRMLFRDTDTVHHFRSKSEMPDVEEASKPFRDTCFPLWMNTLNEQNVQKCSALGYVNHVKCALFVIIRSCFLGHVFPNRDKRWAQMTVMGLNKIMNFAECLQEGEYRVWPGLQDKDCPWREVGWLHG